ncbi:MAG: hypothetical protein LBD88_04595 [Candidatus Peribacteria bacterium]|jgi:hypothetical protein|nr:hypothetical protein [Candidatus Peribacteria bacterium]
MEILGFAEVLLDVIGDGVPGLEASNKFRRQVIGLVVVVFLGIIVLIGMKLVFYINL